MESFFSDNQVADIQQLCYCICEAKTGQLKSKLKETLYNFVLDSKRTNDDTLTDEELRVGQEDGKLKCVKLFKDRTGRSLMESKVAVEKYFEENGYKFYSPKFPY